jgi:hypothetical protein
MKQQKGSPSVCRYYRSLHSRLGGKSCFHVHMNANSKEKIFEDTNMSELTNHTRCDSQLISFGISVPLAVLGGLKSWFRIDREGLLQFRTSDHH